MMLISLIICLSSEVIYSQQVKEFFIGAHSVHDSANYNGSHRVWRGSEMSDEGWTKLEELGITMPLFDIRPENVNANFPRDLIDAARGRGFKVALNDDYIINVGRAQRRLYQAEESKDFTYRISKDPFSVGYQSNFDDDQFDRDPTQRDKLDPTTNVALFSPDTTHVGVALSGWVHRRELNLGTVYFLSARLALKTGSNPAPTDTVLRFVFRVKNQTHNDSISEIVWGNQITTTPSERFLKYFRIDLTSDEAPGHPKTCDSCRYKLTMYDTRPSDLGGSSLMTRKGAHWEDPGPDELILEVVYQKKANVYLDQINISDELGYAFFIGDDHCLPEHQKAPGALTTPLDRDLPSHQTGY